MVGFRSSLVLSLALLTPIAVEAMTYPYSVAAVLSVDPRGSRLSVRGRVELRGASTSSQLMKTVRVHGTPAGRDKQGRIKVSDNSMDVVTPSADGTYDLSLGGQVLWLIEATADGYETAAVVVSSGAHIEFVLVPRSTTR